MDAAWVQASVPAGASVDKWGRPVAVGAVFILSAVALFVFAGVLLGAAARGEIGYDADFYVEAARRWLTTGEFYYPRQFNGRYSAEGLVMLYPPVALYLFVPFTVLPRFLWWAVPLGVIVWHLWTARPAWWSWPVMAGLLALLPASVILVYGNSDLWASAVIVLACRYGWPAVLLALKPSLVPLSVLWAPRREWWLALAVLLVLALPFGSLWLEWITAMANVDSTVLRSATAVPWLAVPVVGWVARTRYRPLGLSDLRRRPPRRSGGSSGRLRRRWKTPP
jgi:hypothetical protein